MGQTMLFFDFLSHNLVHCPISTFITYARETLSKVFITKQPIGMLPFVLVIIADVSKGCVVAHFDVTFYSN